MLQARAEDALHRRRGLQQHVTQPVRGSGPVVREIVVVTAEHAQFLEQLVAVGEPVHAGLVDAGGVGDHEAVAPIGLRLARVKL